MDAFPTLAAQGVQPDSRPARVRPLLGTPGVNWALTGGRVMADVDPNDLVEITTLGRFNGSDDVLNVWQAKITDPGDGVAQTTVDWAQAWIDDLYDELLAQLVVAFSIDGIEVTNLTQDTFLGQDFTQKVFLNASEALPPQVAGLIVGRTAAPTIDGRKYFGVFGEDQQVGGAWLAAAKVAMAALGGLWRVSFTDANLTVGIGQVVTKSVLLPPVGRDIQAVRVIADTRTQRRRTLGRGS